MAKVAAAGVEGGGGGEPDFEVGFRFRPTEVELVDFYLRRRAQGDLTIPKSFIRELDIYERRPWRLPHHLFPYCNAEEREMYFFTRRRRASGNSSKRFSRAVDEGGLWDGHAAGKPIYKAGRAGGGGGERIRIGHRAQLAFKLFDDRRNKKSTQWILHEYRLVDDRADDVVLCRIHRRKGEGEGEEAPPPAINAQQRADAVADADADDDDEDDDLSFARLLEGELMEAEEEERRAKRQRTEEDDHQTSTSRPKRQRTERGGGHQASAADTDDVGLTMSLDEINAILDDLPSDAPRRRSVDPLDIEQLLECLEAEPLASFDDLPFRLDGDTRQETLSPAAEEMVPATRDCLSPPLPAFAADEHCYDLQALGVRGDFVF